jgi:hypothetical protein
MRKNARATRLLKLFGLLATLATGAAAAAQAHGGPPWGPETPNFNLQAVLRPAADGPEKGFGLVKFRQPNDAEKIVYLDVWVRNLDPDSSYFLQRAVDTAVDDICTGTNWLTLGQGLMPMAIETDQRGTGRAALFRSLAAIPLGAEFDIHFRVIDAATSEVVLQSGCYQFAVSQ